MNGRPRQEEHGASMSERLLEVRDLSVAFGSADPSVRSVSFHIDRGETLALVGESGSGKSVSALSILQLLPYPVASHPSGSIRYRGTELLGAPERTLRDIRGGKIAMIFQEPMTSLNPLHDIERQINEALFLHKGLTRAAARKRTLELLHLVGIPNPERRLGAYPHELSGGQRQRVNIARALALRPRLVILDEPVSALDKSVEAQVLNLLADLKERFGLTYVFIGHDLNVVQYISDRVLVMYLGEVVEIGPVEAIYERPAHPYTRALLASRPSMDPARRRTEPPLTGDPPNPIDPPSGCRFRTRCPHAEPVCAERSPPAADLGGGHEARCLMALPGSGHSQAARAAA